MLTLIYIVIFVILFLIISNVLAENTSVFGDYPKVLAFCVTVLCMIGMSEAFSGIEGIEVNVVVLPYAALVISVIFVFLLKAILWVFRKKEGSSFSAKEKSSSKQSRR
ncbi:MAG: hypothetical protein JEZ07_17790 [Phycisphaerae bacterium]|nr:hypothetical protein [Phycisphaerae bacterium]